MEGPLSFRCKLNKGDDNQRSMNKDKDQVSLVRCHDYSPEQVGGAVRRAVDLLGGLDRFVSPGQKVLVKPNLLLMALRIDASPLTQRWSLRSRSC